MLNGLNDVSWNRFTDQRPINPVVQVFARNASSNCYFRALFSRYSASFQPVLNMLAKNTTTDSVSEPCGNTVEHVNGPLNSRFLYHSDAPQQISLHSNRQTDLLSSDAKLFAMKTLAEQVKEFMEWRSAQTSKSFGPSEMASAVALHQKNVEAKKRCKRQNIESLISKDQKTTLYLVALARAMGTSAEVLQLGKYSPPALAKDEPADPSQGIEVEVEGNSDEPQTVDAIRVKLLANSGSMGSGCDTLPDDVLVGQISLSPEWVRGRLRPSSVEALRFIHAYGDSMCPTFADGDVLLVDTGAIDPSRADGVYVLSTVARVFIKRVTSRFDGGFDVSSDNPAVKIISSLNGDHDVNVLGRVVWVWNGKRL